MVAALLLSLALFQSAQQPAQSTSPQMGTPKPLSDEKIEKCILEGKVVSAVDGQPLKKTVVTLFPQSQTGTMMRPLVTSTDADGKFLFRDIDAARYTLNFYRNGYARTNYGARVPNGPGTTLALLPGQHLKDINARLTPAAAINGRIIDEDNDPVANVFLQLQRWGYMNGKRQLIPFGGATTDDRGQFRLHSIAPGRYYVSATYESPGAMMFGQTDANAKDSDETYAPTYYPGVFDISQASTIDLKAGDDIIGIVFRLQRAKAVRVSGTVRGPEGPVKNAMVQILPRGQAFFGGRMNMRSTDDKGNFTLTGVMPGSYVLFVRGMMDQQQLSGRTEIDVTNQAIDGVNIEATTGADIEAQVHLDGNVDLSKTTTRLFLTPQDPMPMGGGAAQIKDAGTITLTKVYDGNYIVRAAPLPDDAYVSKVVCEDKDALTEGVKVRGGAPQLEITISASGAHMTGRVNDKNHNPFTGAFVALVPEEAKRSRQDLFRTATSDQYGHFELRGIPPGTYKLFAWDAIDQGAYMDPDFLKTYDDQGKTVELSAGEKSSPDVTVIVTKPGA